jgi:hypothetical protein
VAYFLHSSPALRIPPVYFHNVQRQQPQESAGSIRERARQAHARQLQALLKQVLQLDLPVDDDPCIVEGLPFTCRGSSAFYWLALLADCPVCGARGATSSMSIREYADLEAAIREVQRGEQSPCVPCARRWKEQASAGTSPALPGGLSFPN